MKFGKLLVMMFVALAFLGVVGGGCIYGGYNRAVRLNEEVKSRWAQVENQLQRRFDLIDNLVATVKGFAQQEQDIFLGVAKSREAYFKADSVNDKAKAAGSFESALSRLLVLRETYPELKSNESFLKLQDSVEGTENRLSTERMRYNEGVKELNAFVRSLLGRLYSNLAGVEQAEYFEITDAVREVPKVDFSKPKTGG